MALARKFTFMADKAGNCAVAGLTVVLCGSDGTAVSMFRKCVRAATKRADDEVGRATTPVDVVAQAMAPGALGEEGATYERFDRADVDSVKGGGRRCIISRPEPSGS